MSRKIFSAILAVTVSLISIFATSCGQSSDKMRSSGGFYEVFVVCTQERWNSALGDTIRSIMLAPVPMINQREPIFDVRYIQPINYNGIVLQHKNVFFVKVGAEYTEPALTVEYDLYAAPQILVSLTAPSNGAATAYISEHRYELKVIFELAERERAIEKAKKHGDKEIQDKILKTFGMEMSIPKGYKLRDTKSDFMWMSYELPLASQGFMVYSYPYTGKENFSLDSLVARRNQFTSLVPGPVKNSFMTTASVEPDLRHVRLGDRYWAEMRGFWDVDGDFMGGPFISYSTVDLKTRRVITIDMYVYSPKKPKRNYLRQLEMLVYTARFPEQPITQPTQESETAQ